MCIIEKMEVAAAADQASACAQDSGEWWEHCLPFRHFRVRDFLRAEHYRTAEATFQEILDNTEGRAAGTLRLEFSASNYSARMLAISHRLAPRFCPIFSESFIRSLYDLMGLPYLPRIDAALHSNPAGSPHGWIHNDFCSAWFDESEPSNGALTFPNRARVQYFDGVVKAKGAKPVEYARAATLIFYLANHGWEPGDGGETGLYSSARESLRTTCELAAPENNTALFFECSPHSYHRFVANPGRIRNSLILWLHCEVDYAQTKWGRAGLTRRKPRP